MYNRLNIKEFQLTDADEYSEFGINTSADDPLSCCMPGSYFTCSNKTSDLGLCPSFMAQRCATKWDNYCDVYMEAIPDWNSRKNFINQTAEKKYCSLAQGSNCTKLCQPFDPIAQQSFQVCDFVGTEIISINGNKVVPPTTVQPNNAPAPSPTITPAVIVTPASSTTTPSSSSVVVTPITPASSTVVISPIPSSTNLSMRRFSDTISNSIDNPSVYTDFTNPTYMVQPCNKTCDLIDSNILTMNDPVINNCLTYGLCSDVLANICDTADKKGVKVAHTDLANLCEIRKSNLNPNSISTEIPTKLSLNNDYITDTKTDKNSIILGVSAIVLIIIVIILIVMYLNKNQRHR